MKQKLKIIINISNLLLLGFIFLSCGGDNYIDDEYIFPIEDNSQSDSTDTGKTTPKDPIVFSELKVSESTDIVYSARNFIIEKKEKNNKKYIRISKDLGKTWKELENPYGDLVYFHIFSTGDILFATTSWCYYIDSSLTSISPSQVYDYNGTIFQPVALEHFFQIGDSKNYIWTIDGYEILAWGDYSYGQGTDPKYVARVWYTNDLGRTVKCAIKFNETKIDGKVQKCRHTHGVRFDKFDKCFYIPTGDSASECQLIRGEYNPQQDLWEFHRLGYGINYKFSRIYFDKNYLYFVTDYTTSQTQTGLLRCKKDSLNDTSKFEYLYKNEENRALTTLEFDMNGNKVLTPDLTGKTFIYYARGNYDFKKIPTNKNSVITGFTSPNYSGDVYARISQGFPFKLGSYFNFTESMRKSGVIDYMEIKEPKSLYYDEDFFFTYHNE